ncbi:MAG TPA: UDP-N-acetylmuramoyl-L-alanine--D-glutamate ligase [Thermoanaerobaculia bacterium]|nr:UDP-N-acetylmuramoyl-L-alanine--D-glutamate ligase [Thermoanaerobaculia bacterium]
MRLATVKPAEPSLQLDRGRWRRALVYGLGASGRAAASALLHRGYAVLGVDDRTFAADELGELRAAGLSVVAATELESLPAELDVVVKSPGVPPSRPLVAQARAQNVPVIGEIELAFPWLDGDLVGITGSNGKSTTTALTGALLRGCGFAAEICGNFGPPLASLLDGPPGRVFVAELSSFQLEDSVTLRPKVAALLNVAADHLDRHGDLAGYLAAKARIFARQGPGCVAVLNEDDPLVRDVALPPGVRRRGFSRLQPVADGCFVDGAAVVEGHGDGRATELFRLDDLHLVGPHNLENALAAALVARSYAGEERAPAAALRAAVDEFRALPHRTQLVRERRGVEYYDDSKGTNPGATERALEGFADGAVHLICGGRSKGADFSVLRDIVTRKVKALYLIGESAAELAHALRGTAPMFGTETLARAVATASASAASGEVVLLSPACASFDQFRDFAHRGETFQRLVRELPGN